MDINSAVANYIYKNGLDSSYAETYAAQLKELGEKIGYTYGEDRSIFDFDDSATLEELQDFFQDAVGSDDYEETIEFLFNCLDTDESGELSADELELFSDNNTIDTFTVWNQLLNADVNAVSSKLSALEDTEDTDDTDDSDNDIDDSDSGEDGSEDSDYTDSEIAEIAQDIYDGNASLSDYYGIMSYEDFNALTTAVEELSDSDSSGSSDTDSSDNSGLGAADLFSNGTTITYNSDETGSDTGLTLTNWNVIDPSYKV